MAYQLVLPFWFLLRTLIVLSSVWPHMSLTPESDLRLGRYNTGKALFTSVPWLLFINKAMALCWIPCLMDPNSAQRTQLMHTMLLLQSDLTVLLIAGWSYHGSEQKACVPCSSLPAAGSDSGQSVENIR